LIIKLPRLHKDASEKCLNEDDRLKCLFEKKFESSVCDRFGEEVRGDVRDILGRLVACPNPSCNSPICPTCRLNRIDKIAQGIRVGLRNIPNFMKISRRLVHVIITAKRVFGEDIGILEADRIRFDCLQGSLRRFTKKLRGHGAMFSSVELGEMGSWHIHLLIHTDFTNEKIRKFFKKQHGIEVYWTKDFDRGKLNDKISYILKPIMSKRGHKINRIDAIQYALISKGHRVISRTGYFKR
jgi:hypothetical protein